MERDLEADLKNDPEIVRKIQNDVYAQNVYAALCNTRWQVQDLWPVLKDEYWSCSWRSAGGIVADLRLKGEDYMDFYCSGIAGGFDFDDAEEHQDDDDRLSYVSEGTVTDEIRADFTRLGWHPSPWPKDDAL